MKRRRWGVVGWVEASLLLAMVLPAGAQQLGRVEGQVLGRDGKPLVGATVEFERTDLKQHFEVRTDVKGNYLHATLPAGLSVRYTIRVIHQGEKYELYRNYPLAIGASQRLDIDLKKELESRQPTEQEKQRVEESKRLQDAFDRAVTLNREGKYEDALAELVPLVEKDPTQWVVHAQMGVAYQNLKRYPEAEASYKKAIELQPSNPTLYSNLGQVYVKTGKQKEARQMFDAAAQLSPEDASSAYFNIAVTFINAGDMKAAVDPLRKAIEYDPNRAEAHYWLGMCLFNQSEYKTEGGELKTIVPAGTREAFERYLQLQPNGQYAADAKSMLEAIDATVPASMRVKKK